MTQHTDTYLIRQKPYYHPQGDEIALYEAAYEERLPVMIKGSTGCGKSRFIEYMAWRLGKPLITVACNEDRPPPTWSAVACSTPMAPAGWTVR